MCIYTSVHAEAHFTRGPSAKQQSMHLNRNIIIMTDRHIKRVCVCVSARQSECVTLALGRGGVEAVKHGNTLDRFESPGGETSLNN